MGLNKSKGNMYQFIDATWNTVKGTCPHDCSYCYVKRWGSLNPARFDEKELKTDLGSGNFIFVGSSCDMWADNIPYVWIKKTLDHCREYDNKYLLQTKNPARIESVLQELPKNCSLCVTIETNRHYPDKMRKSPTPYGRAHATNMLANLWGNIMVTIEPIMDFDLKEMVDIINSCIPQEVNIGADSGNNNLPEPPREKVLELITELGKFTTVHQKPNLKRLF